MEAKAGILLHPTSLPSGHGIGDLGAGAYEFIDFLEQSGQKLWQILPLNPVGYGESPYQPFSAFAGNHLLISLDKLKTAGFLTTAEAATTLVFPKDRVQFDLVKEFKEKMFRLAFTRFKASSGSGEYYSFLRENKIWLENYALFMALKKHFHGVAWNYWEESIAVRDKGAIAYYQELLAEEVAYQKFLQFIFFTQWSAVKKYANQREIAIIGDLPIFISYDSSDTWANPELFQLDESGHPAQVAGVPPDYFSATGQLWGNPHYQWTEMEKDDYQWWRERLVSLLTYVDMIRIDHFRGFEAYWEIPGGAETAINGRWVPGPGERFFKTIKDYLGNLPLIAEDLGIITPAVDELKNKFSFPGMKVLHFMFEAGIKEVFLSLFAHNCVLYTGTHDNDTTLGWYQKVLQERPEVAKTAQKYFQIAPELVEQEICWRFIKIALESRAQMVIIPLQDILCLDSEARMNYPGTIGGNWEWRYQREKLTVGLAKRLAGLVAAAGR